MTSNWRWLSVVGVIFALLLALVTSSAPSAADGISVSGATSIYDRPTAPTRFDSASAHARGPTHEGVFTAADTSDWATAASVAANGADDLTLVGRWMSLDEHAAMVRSGEVQVSGGGTTHVAHPPSMSAYQRQAAPGSVYVEFDVPATTLRPGGAPGWAQIPSPSYPLYGRLAEKSGNPLMSPVPACNIVVVGSC